MKKLFILALAAVMMAGCLEKGKVEVTDDTTRVVYSDGGYGETRVIEIDSCEYITSHVNSGNVIIHKQDCRFCNERRQKEIEWIVNELKKGGRDD